MLYYFVLSAAVTSLAFIFLQPVFEAVAVDAGLAPADVESADRATVLSAMAMVSAVAVVPFQLAPGRSPT